MKTKTTIPALIFSFIILFCFTGLGQVNGDYRSKKSGQWKKKNTWEIYNNSSWSNANYAPTNCSGNTITIQSGHNVVYNKNNAKVKDLIVENNATLSASTNSWSITMEVFGNITCDGTIGTGNDFISVKMNSVSTTISGNGTCEFYNIYKFSNDDNSDLIIDNQVTIQTNSGAAIYNHKNNSFLNIVINPGAALTAESYIDLIYGNGDKKSTLLIKSDETGHGSLITEYVDDSDETNTTIERYLTENMWHYICPLVENSPAAVFNNIWLMQFDEPSGSWSYIEDPNAILGEDMQGYAAWAASNLTGSTTLEFEGTIKSGEQSIAVTRTDEATHGHRGFNFVGNPYSSAIDWEYDGTNGWTKTNVDNAVYMWNGDFGGYGSYVNGIGVNEVTNIIPPHQGFFVHCREDNGMLTVNQGAQVQNDEPFFKGGNNYDFISKLTVEGNGYKDETVVRLAGTSTLSFDSNWDALKMFGVYNAPQVFSIIEADQYLSINSVPGNQKGTIVKLGFKANNPGMYTISYEEVSGPFTGEHVILIDQVTGEKVMLKEVGQHKFVHTGSEDVHRFNLLFINNGGTSSGKSAALNANVYSYNSTIHIDAPEANSYKVQVYNLMGQEVISQTVNSNSSNFNIEQEGYYIVNVISDTEVKTTKVYIE